MHFNFDFSTAQILWTLTFAALLVLLVVLLGRERAQRFPLFTTSIAMMAVLLLTTQLLLSRLPRFTGTEIFLVLSNLDTLIGLLVLVELARRSFRGLGKIGWTVGTLVVLLIGVVVLLLWGHWPAWKTLTASSELATIRLMDLAVDKGILFSSVLTVELGVLVTLLGRRYGAGWRSHAQQIMIGLSTASIAQLILRGSLQAIGTYTHVHSQAEYDHVMDLREKLIHGNNAAYLCVLVWWIACMWVDEPGASSAAAAAGAEPADREDATSEAEPDEAESPEDSAAGLSPDPPNESSSTHLND
ncbi:MAG TPA: hypothetical protein VMT38_09710 [Terracidiphilus sp.]|nr:hypothetical protein [Terracidiphilus sp.]